ncbi:MAG: aminoacyl-tRNA hydrolase [Geminicoccaceae bacterium]
MATAVQLRFDVRGSPSLPRPSGSGWSGWPSWRLSRDGMLVIDARRYRAQERNREDARERLAALVRAAEELPTARRATRPTPGEPRAAARRQGRAVAREGAAHEAAGPE